MALPPEYRGNFHAKGRAYKRAEELGVPDLVGGVPKRAELVMVASYEDHRAVRPSPVILVNHGAGQTYIDAGEQDKSYSGGRDRERVVLHICPSERDAEVCRRAGHLAAGVGVPKLDRFHTGRGRTRTEPPVVAVSFHADIHVCPETRSAFSHYRQALIDLARTPDLPFTLLGHAHPRWTLYLQKFWTRLGVEFVADFDEVLDRADLYVIDNSSTLYEFASTGRPVLTLNAPWYRRSVHHGLRFWSAIPGLQVDHPANLRDRITIALEDWDVFKQMRERAVKVAYDDLCDGHATQRAVAAIASYLTGVTTPPSAPTLSQDPKGG